MSDGYTQPEARIERIDADAVCAQCGTVNPEDTLLCKTCGNNLRDQRAQRVVAAIPPEALAEPEKLSLLAKLLALFGILVIIWVAINMKNIEDGLVGIQSEDSNADIYWTSLSDRKIYEEMLIQLESTPVTAEESARALQQPADSRNLEGRYTLVASNAVGGKYVVGQANVRIDNDRVLFVALIDSQEAEIRGEARIEATGRLAARDTAGILVQKKYYGVSGVASKSDTGGYDCTGVSDYDSQIWTATAYRIPDY